MGPVCSRVVSCSVLGLVEEVVGAAGEFARDGERGSLAAALALDGEVEGVVGAARSAGVVGGFDERPAKLG